MAKGSQLSQLKAALSKAGVTGNQQQSKSKNGKRKRPSGAQEKDKAKRAAKLDEIHKRLNPFDVKVTKLKHDVGGRKVKGVTGKPTQSRQAGIEQRKKTLLKEYEEKGRAGGILDRRFGENDPSMSVEERMLERFTRERQRASKGVAFNLEDEDELTHYGQSLSKLDDFDGAGLRMDEDEEEDEEAPHKMDVAAHFKGFSDDEDEPERKKTKAEVMSEVIAKSKAYKMQHQMEREEEDNVRHELDQQFDSLRSLLFSAPKAAPAEDAAKTTLMDTDIVPDDPDYDQRVRELAFDARAKPKDRMKTEEEVARAEKEALEKAERSRRKRMLGLEESDSEEEGGRSKKRRRRERGGDDLDDDFELDGDEPWEGIGAGLGEKQDKEGSEEDDDEEGSGGDEEESGSEDDDEDDESESDEDGEHENLTSAKKPSSKGKSKAKELPFTFPCPATHDELLEILDDVHDADVSTVIQRIRSLFHTSLAPENKFKLQTLASVLIDHILYVSPNFTLVSALLPHLFALTRAYPIPVAEHFVSKLSLMHKNLRRGLSRGALDPASKTWPGVAELTLLRIIGAAWPTSDMNHAVVSPTRVLISAYLGLARVRSVADIASGLFLCTLVLQFEALSKRFVPEAVNFAVNAVLHLAPHDYPDAASVPGSFPIPDFGIGLGLKKLKDKELPKPELAQLLAAADDNTDAKSQLLLLAVDLLGKFGEVYKPLDGFVELYTPILTILRSLPKHTRISSTTDTLARLLKFASAARRPLLLQAHKPIPIPSYVPKFEMSKSSYLRNTDPDRERNAAAKLKAQYKQERKGAIRELRKDARFLAGVEQERQREKDRGISTPMLLPRLFTRQISPARPLRFLSTASVTPVELHATSQIPGNNATDGAIVILHGIFGSARNWGAHSRAFARHLNRPVYALDLRNHGASAHTTPMNYSAMAADVMHFIRQRSLSNVCLIGHSMGGKVAMSVALDPTLPAETLSMLVVADIAPAKGSLSAEFKSYIVAMQKIEAAKVSSRKEALAILNEFEKDPDVCAFLLTNLVQKPDGGSHFRIPVNLIGAAIEEMGSFPFEPEERQWDGKTLFVKASKSSYINRHNIPLAEKFFPNMRLETLETGHWVHSEKPHEFGGLVQEFLGPYTG
ncbi:hypothetical protein MKEN_00150200 [Mycena kentingensis (nom. inval.)]|nr:hypothetical protein MKEN_00150200 [Mycena kentingensis (nom. inval.)]